MYSILPMPSRSTRGERGSSAYCFGSHFWNRCGGSTTWSSTLMNRGMSRAMGSSFLVVGLSWGDR